ncbi:MAG: isoprenylcysteine carboxylmethyltransferase family protein [Chloroflexi bacterium]|nr:isoprenylcysteine carboxylmethyltransferase family protein [Chloroflexota bacterium]
MQLFSKWAKREHSLARRIAVLALAAVLFLYLLPLAVIRGGSSLDRALGLPALDLGAANYILGGVLGVVGLFFAFWSIGDQVTRGRGTPLPMMPTQELLTRGPFRYCRNPMTLGTILAYSGLGIAAGTISGVGLVLCFGAFLVLYIKGIEEKELAERFGEAYLAYKRQVPFIIPRRPKRG